MRRLAGPVRILMVPGEILDFHYHGIEVDEVRHECIATVRDNRNIGVVMHTFPQFQVESPDEDIEGFAWVSY